MPPWPRPLRVTVGLTCVLYACLASSLPTLTRTATAAVLVPAAAVVVLAMRRRAEPHPTSSQVRPDLLARFGSALDVVLARHLVLRLAILLAWAWLGWHFLARTG